MDQLGHSTQHAAKLMGVSEGHLSLLRNGTRDLRKISPDLLKQMAKYIGVPLGEVKLMTGILRPEDFEALPMTAQIEQAVRHIIADPQWGWVAPADVAAASTKLKRLLVGLYQGATGKTLVPGLVVRTRDCLDAVGHLQTHAHS